MLAEALIMDLVRSATSTHYGFLKGRRYRKVHIIWKPFADSVIEAMSSSSVDLSVKLPSLSSVRYSCKFSSPGQLAYVYLYNFVTVEPGSSCSSLAMTGSLS